MIIEDKWCLLIIWPQAPYMVALASFEISAELIQFLTKH
jgi:hypothetical protein